MLTKDKIFYCNSDEGILLQHALDDGQEITIYEIPKGNSLSLLTYDAEWIYFLQTSSIDESNKSASSIMRVNLQDHRIEEIYELQPGNIMSNFNVYGNNCYFILSGADTTQWQCIDLTNGEVTSIHGEKCFISTLNSFQVNMNAYNYFFDYIGEGRGFCESDFQYKGNEKVPIILGNDYKSYYVIGDSINLNYLEKDFEYEIIGFFEQGLRLKIGNSEYNMDKYLCVPFFEFNGNVVDDSEKISWLRCYEEKNLGYIKVDMTDDSSEEETVEFYAAKIQESAEGLKLKYSTLAIAYDISSEIAN